MATQFSQLVGTLAVSCVSVSVMRSFLMKVINTRSFYANSADRAQRADKIMTSPRAKECSIIARRRLSRTTKAGTHNIR